MKQQNFEKTKNKRRNMMLAHINLKVVILFKIEVNHILY